MSDTGVHASVVPKSAALKTSRFKVPGEGASGAISVATVVGLLVLWFLVTNLGLIKPLFLPSPQAVFQQFYEYLTGSCQRQAPVGTPGLQRAAGIDGVLARAF